MKTKLILLSLLFVGCGPSREESTGIKPEIIYADFDDEVKIVTVDSCEYVIWDGYHAGGIVHKANCKNH